LTPDPAAVASRRATDFRSGALVESAGMPSPSRLQAIRRRRPPSRAVASLLAATAIALAGCGSSTPARNGSPAQESSVSTVTPSGLHYSFQLTVRNGQECSTATYAGAGPKHQPLHQTQKFCGSAGQAAPPTLIQVSRPAASLILDRPAACATVTVARTHRPATPATTRCSTTTPHLRLTLLPTGRSLTIHGIPGVRTIDLAKIECTYICTRQLALDG
jgi:hypothetical protein